MKSGLVSVTFRKLTIDEIIKLAKENNLKSIEWGSSHRTGILIGRVDEDSDTNREDHVGTRPATHHGARPQREPALQHLDLGLPAYMRK